MPIYKGTWLHFEQTLPHEASAPFHTPVSSQNQPQTTPMVSWAWEGTQKTWPPGTWGRQRCQMSIKLLGNLTFQQIKGPIIQSVAWQSWIKLGYFLQNKSICFYFLSLDNGTSNLISGILVLIVYVTVIVPEFVLLSTTSGIKKKTSLRRRPCWWF